MLEPSNYNKEHPEIKENETFYMNVTEDEIENANMAPFIESYRLGDVAYDNNGNVVEGYKPMFIILADGVF